MVPPPRSALEAERDDDDEARALKMIPLSSGRGSSSGRYSHRSNAGAGARAALYGETAALSPPPTNRLWLDLPGGAAKPRRDAGGAHTPYQQNPPQQQQQQQQQPLKTQQPPPRPQPTNTGDFLLTGVSPEGRCFAKSPKIPRIGSVYIPVFTYCSEYLNGT